MAEDGRSLCAIEKEIENPPTPAVLLLGHLSQAGPWDSSVKIIAGGMEVEMQIPGTHPGPTASEGYLLLYIF